MKLKIPLSLLAVSFACSSLALAADDAAAPTAATTESSRRPFTALTLANPRGIAVDRSGELYVIDADSRKMYKISPKGSVSAFEAPAIKTPIGLTVASDGTVFVADAEGSAVYRISPGGAAAALTVPEGETSFQEPTNVAVDAAGNVFVANNLSNAILRITPKNEASVFAGKVGESGSADGPAGTARFNTPLGITIDAAGNLYVADKDNSNIRKITPDGIVSTLAGIAGQTGSADGEGAAARFAAPRALAADAAGTVYVADTENYCVRKITPAGAVSTFAGVAGQPGNADGAGSAARFSVPRGIAVDASGNVFVADSGNGTVRQITRNGLVTTIVAPAPTGADAMVTKPAPTVSPRTGQPERVDYSHAQTLDGWDGDPAFWTVKDGAFTAKGDQAPSTFLLTRKNYSDFRLILRSQMVESENHAGVALWGEQTASSNGKNTWAYKGPLVIFPGLALWDYRTNKNIPIDPSGKALAKKIAGQHDMTLVEILAQGNRVRVAYNGQQVLDWREPDPSLLKDGPIGLQLHGYAKPQEVVYKDVVIESFPQEDRLTTVKE